MNQQIFKQRLAAVKTAHLNRLDLIAACMWRTTFTEECVYTSDRIPVWNQRTAAEAWCLEHCRERFFVRSLERTEDTIEWEFGFEDVTDLADFNLAMEIGL